MGDEGVEDGIDLDDLTVLLRYMVDILRPKIDDFADALMLSVDLLGKCYQANKDFKSAALILSSFKPDDHRGKCSTTAEQRVEWYISIAEHWLEVQETGPASQAIKRAHALQVWIYHILFFIYYCIMMLNKQMYTVSDVLTLGDGHLYMSFRCHGMMILPPLP